jgi:hypothetical protein
VFFEVNNLSQYGLDFDGFLYVDTLWINLKCELLSK